MMKKIIDWINRTITHNRDRDGDFGIRVILHIPIGGVICYAIAIDPWVGIALLLLFLSYEWLEDWRVKEHSWKDLFGALVGFVLVFVGLQIV